MLSGVETAESEAGGLAAGIPVLAGQSTIDDLLGGFGIYSRPGPQEALMDQAANGIVCSQPALF